MIRAEDDENWLDVRNRHMGNFPARLSELTKLTNLVVAFALGATHNVNIERLCSLVTLQRLKLTVAGLFVVSDSLSQLQQLSDLRLSCTSPPPVTPHCLLTGQHCKA